MSENRILQIASYISPLDNLSHSRNLPDECWNDFGINPKDSNGPATQIEVLTLTGPSPSYPNASPVNSYTAYPNLNYSCPTFLDGNVTYWQTNANFLTSWDYAMHRAYPILSVFFKVADANLAAFYDTSNPPAAQLSCPRPTNFTKGTRVPPRLPEGTPTSTKISSSSDYSLSFGAASGIVAGCIIAFLITLGVGLFLYLRRRKLRKRRDDEGLAKAEESGMSSTELHAKHLVEADPRAAIVPEADPTAFPKAEALGYEIYELESPTAELDSTGTYAPKL